MHCGQGKLCSLFISSGVRPLESLCAAGGHGVPKRPPGCKHNERFNSQSSLMAFFPLSPSFFFFLQKSRHSHYGPRLVSVEQILSTLMLEKVVERIFPVPLPGHSEIKPALSHMFCGDLDRHACKQEQSEACHTPVIRRGPKGETHN